MAKRIWHAPHPTKVGIYEVKTRDGGQLLAKWEDRAWWIHGTGPAGLRVRRQLDGMSAVTAWRPEGKTGDRNET